MAILRGGGMNEGSLLRRTLLHIGTFAFGSLAFVAVVSFLLVSIARSLLPSHGAKGASDTRKEATEEAKDGAAKPTVAKTTKPRRGSKDVIVEEEKPNADAEK